MGSKNRHAKEILPVVLADRKPGQWYVEPFVGGFNMIDKVDGKRIGNDNNYYLVSLFRALQDGWIPPDSVSETLYNNIRLSIKKQENEYPPHLIGFVGFGCSYSGKWFGGYARGNTSKGVPRNYCLESKKNVLKQVPKIKNVLIENMDYRDLCLPDNSIVYCDPPYKGTTNYKKPFDHDSFWKWVRKISREGHVVYVSEYSAPDDFECLWSKVVNNTLVKETGSKQGVERLFKMK